MKVEVVRNHDGMSPCGSKYDEGRIIQEGLQNFGHVVSLENPASGFIGNPVKHSDHIVITTQPEKHNRLLEDFLLRHPAAPIAWRPGHSQLALVEKLMPKVRVVHLCTEKAYSLTGLLSLSDAAQVIGNWNPYALVVVSDPTGASVCQYGRITKVYAFKFAHASEPDGRGPAFFGAFLGEWLNSGNIALSIAAGHRYGAAMATGNWARRDLFSQDLPAPAMAIAA